MNFSADVSFMLMLAQCPAMPTSSMFMPVSILAFGMLVSAFSPVQVAGASAVRMHAAEIRQGQLQMSGADVSLEESAKVRALRLHAQTLIIPVLELSGILDWHCPLQPDKQGDWSCAGPLTFKDSHAGTLDTNLHAHVQPGRIELEFSRGKTRATIRIPIAAREAVQIEASRLPATWFSRVMRDGWPDGQLKSGMLDARASIISDGAIAGTYSLDNLAFDSRDGSIAGDKLALDGTLNVKGDGAALRIALTGNLHGGEALLGPIYVKWPKSAVHFALDAQPAATHGWNISRFEWKDPGVLDLGAHGTFDTQDAQGLQFDVDVQHAYLPAFVDRYAANWLSAQGFDNLESNGKLAGSIGIAGGALTNLALQLDNVSVQDASDRFGINGLHGAIDWSIDGERPKTTLAWSDAGFYRMQLDAATLQMQSRDGRIALIDSARIGTLGGNVALNAFSFRPLAQSGERFGVGFALVGIDLARLTHALGWPEFTGTLGGAVPHVGYDGNMLVLDGGLSLQAFDGSISVTRMSLERPFGVAPSLSADIALSNIDLQQLTSVFSFGEITGRLDGHIRDLRLVDWKPTAFEAGFRADKGGRISQKAIGSLSSVGGAGIGGGIQGVALKLFDTFGYARLGLDCRLVDNVCHMDGIGAASGNGYTIVEGSGLPRITVVGFQHNVDWPTLVARLVAATQGNGPEIR